MESYRLWETFVVFKKQNGVPYWKFVCIRQDKHIIMPYALYLFQKPLRHNVVPKKVISDPTV